MDIGKRQRVIVVTPLEVTGDDGHVDEGETPTLWAAHVDDAVIQQAEAPASTRRAHMRAGSTDRPHGR